MTSNRLHALLTCVVLLGAGCMGNKELQTRVAELEASRSPDARKGVLANEVPPETLARLELLGRTSAPSRYAERIDANRIRVVALDFGGAFLGQCSDLAGNLLPQDCRPRQLLEYWPDHNPLTGHSTLDEDKRANKGEVGEASEPSSNPAPRSSPAPRSNASRSKVAEAPANTVQLRAGMFRQYSTQVGTTVETDIDIATFSNENKLFFSRNFMIIEWRRYALQRSLPPLETSDGPRRVADFGPGTSSRYSSPHVSGIEMGIAVRIIFDVRLRTADARISASFGIADLVGALARNEATVEVSYEVVGTTLDLLPEKAWRAACSAGVTGSVGGDFNVGPAVGFEHGAISRWSSRSRPGSTGACCCSPVELAEHGLGPT